MLGTTLINREEWRSWVDQHGRDCWRVAIISATADLVVRAVHATSDNDAGRWLWQIDHVFARAYRIGLFSAEETQTLRDGLVNFWREQR